MPFTTNQGQREQVNFRFTDAVRLFGLKSSRVCASRSINIIVKTTPGLREKQRSPKPSQFARKSAIFLEESLDDVRVKFWRAILLSWNVVE